MTFRPYRFPCSRALAPSSIPSPPFMLVALLAPSPAAAFIIASARDLPAGPHGSRPVPPAAPTCAVYPHRANATTRRASRTVSV